MRKDLVTQWREDIIGEWISVLCGSDLLVMEPSPAEAIFSLTLRVDGVAEYKFEIPNPPSTPPQPTPPFPTRWELSDQRVLSIWLPIAPMPEYDMPEWSREEMPYDVLAVTDLSLTLSNRRFDGEDVTVLKRLNRKEYDLRKAAEYGRIMDALRGKT